MRLVATINNKVSVGFYFTPNQKRVPKLQVRNGSCSRVDMFNLTRTQKSSHIYELKHDPNIHRLTQTRPVRPIFNII
ncbi:hypothetical protein Hanom_Chr11g01012401 [Helianthus anomalus]